MGSDLPRAGYSLWWEKDALFLPFTQRGLFDFLFALGTEGKSSVIEQEGRERRQRKRVTNVGILFRFPEVEMSFPLVGGGKRRLAAKPGAYIHSVPTAQSSLSPTRSFETWGMPTLGEFCCIPGIYKSTS